MQYGRRSKQTELSVAPSIGFEVVERASQSLRVIEHSDRKPVFIGRIAHQLRANPIDFWQSYRNPLPLRIFSEDMIR